MSKSTSFSLGDYLDDFVNKPIASGKFWSASELIKTALLLFKHEELRKQQLINELKAGEESPFLQDSMKLIL
ncbi:type II toxin-antitoxin system ParD family antitoxin [Pelobium manganitolerans]|uniref:type II toxin-antitoxin system ParD family antitoxin n=1 Tax=Pelobium manganitolerans TaxID=1842495 RepID=UPI003FA34587